MLNLIVDPLVEELRYPVHGTPEPITEPTENLYDLFAQYFGITDFKLTTELDAQAVDRQYLLFPFTQGFRTLVEFTDIDFIQVFEKKYRDALVSGKIDLLLFSPNDCFPEFLYTKEKGLFLYFHNIIARWKVEPSRVTIVVPDLDLCKNYGDWCYENKISLKFKIISVDYFSLDCLFRLPKLPEEKDKAERSASTEEKKRFIMMAARTPAHRTAVFFSLLEKNLLHEFFNFSYLNRAREFSLDAMGLADLEEIVGETTMQKGVEKFKLFFKSAPHTLDITDPDSVERNMPEAYFQNSMINVILDTGWQTFRSVFITEKTFKSIAYQQPFILFGSPFALRALRQLGYATFPEIVNEEYDQIENPRHRHQFLIAEIERLCSLKPEAFQTLVYSQTVQAKVRHNFRTFIANARKRQGFQNFYSALGLNSAPLDINSYFGKVESERFVWRS